MINEKAILTQPWERQPNESVEAFRAFRAWLETEYDGVRSIRETYRHLYSKPGAIQAPGYFSTWAAKHHWAARARQYDNDRLRKEQEAEMQGRLAARRQAAKRREQVAQEGWDTALSLIEKGKELLKAPTFKQTVVRETESPDGHTTIQEITIEPAKFALRDAVTFFEAAEKLRRLSLEMVTSIVETVTPQDQAAKRLADARAVLEESRQRFPDQPEERRISQIAEAFGVQPEDLTGPEDGITGSDQVQ